MTMEIVNAVMREILEPLEVNKWLIQAYEEAAKSPDNSTQVGALLLMPNSTNPGVNIALYNHNKYSHGWEVKPEDLERPRKYDLIEHAEAGVIHLAARRGWLTLGSTMVCTWAACANCAKAIVASGVSKLIRHYPISDETTERWLDSVSLGDDILKAGGVQIYDVVGPIPGAPAILRGGEVFDPSV